MRGTRNHATAAAKVGDRKKQNRVPLAQVSLPLQVYKLSLRQNLARPLVQSTVLAAPGEVFSLLEETLSYIALNSGCLN